MPHPNTSARGRAGSFGLSLASSSQIQKFDGRTRSASGWNSLRRDPDLWYDDGDCLVYLYARGQSQRGPSFKIPFSGLVETDCYPLIYRFIAPESGLTWLGRDNDTWHATSTTLELHIPPPAGLTAEESLSFHLATRNFFAWVYNRPVVGEYLGDALAKLLDSMYQMRLPGIQNQMDLIDYMEDQSYLTMKNNPCAAVAVLHLAETCQLRTMYIDAFAHCAGMHSHLDSTPGYHLLSMATKGLLSGATADLEIRLAEAASQLRDFARSDLAGSYGFTASVHVDMFQEFLASFYRHKFGKWPPHPGRTPFEKHEYLALSYDFECLRELLVNEGASEKPVHETTGLNVHRVLAEYDKLRGFKPQKHRTPLIPAVIPRQATWRRLSVLGGKVRPDDRLLANASLARSYNGPSSAVLQNDLVQAYRRFEEDVVTASKEVSICEGRKARWLAVYAVCQILRHVTEAPEEVIDSSGVDYHLAISTEGLPPWSEAQTDAGGFRGRPSEARSAARRPSLGRSRLAHTRLRSSTTHDTQAARSTSRPALSHKQDQRPVNNATRSLSVGTPARNYRPTPSGWSQSSGSSRGHEPLTPDDIQFTQFPPDSATTVTLTDGSTPPASPDYRPSPLETPPRKSRPPRNAMSMMPAAAHAPMPLALSTPMGRKPGGRPLGGDLPGPESASPAKETVDHSVDYAAMVEREREGVYGTRHGVLWI